MTRSANPPWAGTASREWNAGRSIRDTLDVIASEHQAVVDEATFTRLRKARADLFPARPASVARSNQAASARSRRTRA